MTTSRTPVPRAAARQDFALVDVPATSRTSVPRAARWLVGIVCLILFLTSGNALSAQQPGGDAFDPPAVFLTWQRDPTTTMTIDWHLREDQPATALQFRRVGESSWWASRPETVPFPFSDRLIHRVELRGLAPGTDYEFRFGDDAAPYAFRTMPADASRPIRFAAGGDVMSSREWMDQTNRAAARFDLDFVVFGGDLAYANGDPRRVDRWYDWFESLKTTLVTDDGRLIPVLAAIGNHEVFEIRRLVRDGEHERLGERLWGLHGGEPVFFPSLFAYAGASTFSVLDFGDYLSIVLLDTDHVAPVVGAQTEWLRSVLSERRGVPHVFPVYHVPAYPSVRSFDGEVSRQVRENWVPLFEENGVRVVFENHDHAYKRTHPLRNGAIARDGIVYLGDGAWGVGTREIGRDHDDGPPWYLARGESVRHLIVATIHGPHQHLLVVDADGNVFDEYPQSPHESSYTTSQASSIALHGIVHDAAAAPLRDVAVDVAGRTAVTDAGGYFRLEGLSPGVTTIRLHGSAGTGQYRITPDDLRDTLRLAYPVVTEIVLMHDNDLHFNFNHRDAFEAEVGFIRRQYENAWLLNAGDTFVRLPERWAVADTSYYEELSRFMIETMNVVGYDAGVPGNHELDYVGDVTGRSLRLAGFPLIVANVDVATLRLPRFEPFVTFETRNGLSIAVLGLSVVNFEKPGVSARDPIETARAYVNLAAEHDLFVLLNHVGLSNDEALAEALPEIDVIIGGHSHSLLEEAKTVNGVLIGHAGGPPPEHQVDPKWPKYLGVIRVVFENDRIVEKSGHVKMIEAPVLVE